MRCVQLLVERGALLIGDYDGVTPLLTAAYHGKGEVAFYLMKRLDCSVEDQRSAAEALKETKESNLKSSRFDAILPGGRSVVMDVTPYEQVGFGSHGVVFSVRVRLRERAKYDFGNDNGTCPFWLNKCVMKSFNDDALIKSDVGKENLRGLLQLRHSNIVEFFAFGSLPLWLDIPGSPKAGILMEFCKGKTMANYVTES